jgi:hypothetical protein
MPAVASQNLLSDSLIDCKLTRHDDCSDGRLLKSLDDCLSRHGHIYDDSRSWSCSCGDICDCGIEDTRKGSDWVGRGAVRASWAVVQQIVCDLTVGYRIDDCGTWSSDSR